MGSGKHLLLFAVLPLLVRGQQPEVYMMPKLKKAFYGDSVYLTCNTSENSVEWYQNDKLIGTSKTWKIKIKNQADLEPYYCKTSGGKSGAFNIPVGVPDDSPKLSIETGHPVMWEGGAVILKLEHKDLLKGWRCWVYRGGEKQRMVQLRLHDNDKSIAFQTADLNVPETIYWCTDKTRTHRSNQILITTSDDWNSRPEEDGVGVGVGLLVGLMLAVVGLLAVLGGVWMFLRHKRTATGRVYEEVALSSRKQGDDKYETLQKEEREYDTLNPSGSGSQTKSGEYEALNKEKMKEGVYHSLGAEGAPGGEGGYEALKKEGMKEGVYHTLGAEGAAGGEGGYEALKKEGMKEGVYHTLGAEGAAGGEGGYEALKKEGMKEGVYHTLGAEGAAGGEGEMKQASESPGK